MTVNESICTALGRSANHSYLILNLCNIIKPRWKCGFISVPKLTITLTNSCNTMKSVSCLGKQWPFLPEEHPVPDVLVLFDVFLDLSYKPRESVHGLRQVLWVSARTHAVTCTLPSKHNNNNNNNDAFTLVIGWCRPFLMENHSCVPVWHKKFLGRSSRNIVRALPCWHMLVTNQNGPLDLITEVKFSWIQFLKCLRFTDLGHDSKNKHTNSKLLTLLGNLWTPSVSVPEKRVQLWSGGGSSRENVSVFGHQTETILKETMKGVTKFLFLWTDKTL